MKKFFSVLYILSNLLDLSFTVCGINLTSPGMEANLVARDILLSHGFVGLSIFKLAGVAFTLVIAFMLTRRNWSKPWGKHLGIPVLIVGSIVSLVGVWSWIGIFQEV